MVEILHIPQGLVQAHGEKVAREDPAEGAPMESTLALWTQRGGTVRSGTWECTPGSIHVRREGFDEFAVILAGRGVLESEDGERYEHRAGDVLVIPDGFRGTWTVIEPIRKLSVAAPSS
ncbi:cupin domain-containing protein [Agromyces silvae]|uniref:cupin domain-containing protein n=1 Tax=Agromyces silvae TaxID=3388266 RepID=UPI00280C0C71|nr:cupin domain-containing protein [Agromyces protaetiae]